MALEIAERPVVGEDIEAVGRTLEGSSGLMASIVALAFVGVEDSDSFLD
jgi:hypothetical protein